jgi:N-glycosylase/DNA lyase
VQLTQPDKHHIEYRAIWPAPHATFEAPLTPPSSIPPTTTSTADDVSEEDDSHDLIYHYLNLEPNLEALYAQWSESDANFRKRAPQFTGVRILRQDAWEALVGFICSSNNNIIRISQMVDKLCTNYGRYIGILEGREYHDFPGPEDLTGDGVESHLRELGFGYRAKYIAQTARMVALEREEGWLDTLRNPECPAFGTEKAASAGEMKPEGRDGYRAAHQALLELQGVGPKVADCVCLMGLAWRESVPIDTHVWQIAQRDYKLGKGKNSSMTKGTYDMVANQFRKIWGQEAGWAHSVLFTADLKTFAERLTVKVEVDVVKEEADETEVIKNEVVQKVALKRKLERDSPSKTILKIEEVATSASERVKRRRRTQQ